MKEEVPELETVIKISSSGIATEVKGGGIFSELALSFRRSRQRPTPPSEKKPGTREPTAHADWLLHKIKVTSHSYQWIHSTLPTSSTAPHSTPSPLLKRSSQTAPKGTIKFYVCCFDTQSTSEFTANRTLVANLFPADGGALLIHSRPSDISSQQCSYLTPTKADMTKHIWDFHLRATKQPATQFSRVKTAPSGTTDFKPQFETTLLRFAQLHQLLRAGPKWDLFEISEESQTLVCALQAQPTRPQPTVSIELVDPFGEMLSPNESSMSPLELTPASPTAPVESVFAGWEFPSPACDPFAAFASEDLLPLPSPCMKRRFDDGPVSSPKRVPHSN